MKPIWRRVSVSRGSLPQIRILPRARLREAGDDAQQRGLTRAVAADQRQARARFGFELHVAQGRVVAVKLPDALNGDRAHCVSLAGTFPDGAVEQHEAQRQDAERQSQNRLGLVVDARHDLFDLRAAAVRLVGAAASAAGGCRRRSS